ncbi:hypothetical protein ElyMa_002940400 [Elysia marginata]|uniref:Uncharacterized protein n=1 Tax=Elysia marginata TaxID=1093978 RepID=A0AAV4I5B9_9GAST|nr:hypothetical protein ElyMa_002940400 [Elysia marginata]
MKLMLLMISAVFVAAVVVVAVPVPTEGDADKAAATVAEEPQVYEHEPQVNEKTPTVEPTETRKTKSRDPRIALRWNPQGARKKGRGHRVPGRDQKKVTDYRKRIH